MLQLEASELGKGHAETNPMFRIPSPWLCAPREVHVPSEVHVAT
jgi:hypothetical protein